MRQSKVRWRKPPAIAPPSEVRADPGRQRLNVNWRDSVRDEDLELALDDVRCSSFRESSANADQLQAAVSALSSLCHGFAPSVLARAVSLSACGRRPDVRPLTNIRPSHSSSQLFVPKPMSNAHCSRDATGRVSLMSDVSVTTIVKWCPLDYHVDLLVNKLITAILSADLNAR